MSNIERVPHVDIVQRRSLVVEFLVSVSQLCKSTARYLRGPDEIPVPPEPEPRPQAPTTEAQGFQESMRAVRRGGFH